MTTAEMDRVLDAYAEAKNRQDVEGLLDQCHDDCSYESVGLGPAIEGKDALREFYSALFSALPDYRGEFAGRAHGEDSAVVWGHFSGTVKGDFGGLPATGRRIDVPVAFVCGFRDGKLVSDVGYFDVATLCEQAGLPLDALRPASLEPAA